MMTRQSPDVVDCYNLEVVRMLCEKYGFSPLDAFRGFVFSRTHEMLEDEEHGFTDFGAEAVLEMWESEKITGDPRNSIYIRGE